MIIKTITCHNVYNYGASLQAYALQKYLENLGHKVEIIDFQPWFLRVRYNFAFYLPGTLSYKITKRCYILGLLYGYYQKRYFFKTLGRKKKFNLFTKKHLHLTSFRYETCEQLKANPPQADVYIAGSDQIWNVNERNGLDPAFYLDFGDNSVKRVSYAASFAVKEIPINNKEFVKSKVGNIDNISVREKSGLNILFDLGFKEALQVMDPVFLLRPQEWRDLSNMAKHYNIINSKYILLYDFIDDDRIKKFVLKCKTILGYKIVAVNDINTIDYADISISDAGPLEFISLINRSSLVISNSFHATAFSVIFGVPFYVFSLKGHNNSARMEDFLDLCGLKQCFNPSIDISINVNIKDAYNKLSDKIQESKDFLTSTLILH